MGSHLAADHSLDSTLGQACAPEDLPLFKAMARIERDALLAQAIRHKVARGTVLFEQGEQPTFQYVVLAGTVHLFAHAGDGREVVIEVVEPPDLLVPAAVVTGAPYLMEARAIEPSQVLMIPAAAFREALLANLPLAHQLIGSLAGQFRRMVRQIKNLKLRPALERVGCYILGLVERQGTTDQVVLPYEKSLIASELGITRESFSRALLALQQEGIEVRGNTIAILDIERLRQAARPDRLIDGHDSAGFGAPDKGSGA
jgi:CRP/FNR family transcriptional activator FtrB